MSKMYSTANLSDKELKEQGNRLFNLHKFEDAANCYTKAIIKNPNQALYFTNRALAYLKLKRYESSCQDCRRALDLEPCLVKAVDLSKEQKLNYGDDMTSVLRQARKKRFQIKEELRISQEIELQSYINKLIVEDAEKSLAELKLKELNAKDKGEEILTESKLSTLQQEIEEKRDSALTRLNDLFAKVDDLRRRREVPDYLCGKISFEILQEPVITPSGITYERKDIEEHLQRVGHFDPVTRVRLTQDQLIPNLAMKDVVDAFLQENEWALDY
uniref:E3 ubiquitin-protein ligase CHIP n=1 Tax=Trichogramma kaykai TaxID=54128 RepID=A0ABD2VTZ4_9HYME